jgi:hypothetical protein
MLITFSSTDRMAFRQRYYDSVDKGIPAGKARLRKPQRIAVPPVQIGLTKLAGMEPPKQTRDFKL